MKKQQAQKATIIFGGAFNPPTVAHEAILLACVEHAKQLNGDVWIMPSCPNRSDKQITTCRDLRIKYVNAMLGSVSPSNVLINIITSEMDRLEFIETFDTVMDLQVNHPDRNFIWVFGADSIETMSQWKNGQWLLDNLDMLVVERHGSMINEFAKKVQILKVQPNYISSTIVRRRIADGVSIEGMVSQPVRILLENQKTPRLV